MEAPTEAVNTADGKPGDTAQTTGHPCAHLVICIGTFTVGCLAALGTVIALCSVTPPSGSYFPAQRHPYPRELPPPIPRLPREHPKLPRAPGPPERVPQGANDEFPEEDNDRKRRDIGVGRPLLHRVVDDFTLPTRPPAGNFGSLRGSYYGDRDWPYERSTPTTFLNEPGSSDGHSRFWDMLMNLTTGDEPYSGATLIDDTTPEGEEANNAGDSGLHGTPSRNTPSGVIVMRKDTKPPERPSQLYHLPKFGIDVIINGPSAEPGRHTPLYDKTQERVFCFVVAGTDTLGITGAGVNGAMADLIVRESAGYFTRTSLAQATQTIHRHVLEKAKGSPGVLQQVVENSQELYERVFSYYGETTDALPGVEETVGIPILGLLKPKFRIYQNSNNAYLLYIVSPKGTAPDASFHKAYTATWKNLFTLVALVNKDHRQLGVPEIQQLRFPLLSGGIYRSHRPTAMLARTAVTQLLPMAKQAGSNFVLDFMFDADESFFYAIRSSVTSSSDASF